MKNATLNEGQDNEAIMTQLIKDGEMDKIKNLVS